MAEPDARAVGLAGSPTARESRTYRSVLMGLRVIGRGIFAFKTAVLGLEHLPRASDGRPAGGWIAAGLPHRTWVDPFVVADNLPVEPRLIFFGDGGAILRSRWRRWLVRRIGGVIPIWPGAGRPAVEARRFGSGLAYFALRTGAPIVPIILGGTDELYRRRRFRLEILAPVTWQDLVDAPPGTLRPEPWSSAERRVAHRMTLALHERTAESVAAAHLATTPKPGMRKRWRWLTSAWH